MMIPPSAARTLAQADKLDSIAGELTALEHQFIEEQWYRGINMVRLIASMVTILRQEVSGVRMLDGRAR